MRTGIPAALLFAALVAPAAAPAAEREAKRPETRTYRRAELRVSTRAVAPVAADTPADRIFWTGRSEMQGPVVREPVRHDLSIPLTEIERAYQAPKAGDREIEILERVQNNYGAGEPRSPSRTPSSRTGTRTSSPRPSSASKG